MSNENNVIEQQMLQTKEITEADRDRIQMVREKRKKTATSMQFTDGERARSVTNKPYSDKEQGAAQQATICAATGTTNLDYGMQMLSQMISAMPSVNDSNKSDQLNMLFEELLALEPRDAIEGALISRLLVLHNQYMHLLSRSMHAERVDLGDIYLNRSTKLMRLSNETLEALNRYRRKGEQKVTVQHVHVTNGGQAMVNGSATLGVAGMSNKN